MSNSLHALAEAALTKPPLPPPSRPAKKRPVPTSSAIPKKRTSAPSLAMSRRISRIHLLRNTEALRAIMRVQQARSRILSQAMETLIREGPRRVESLVWTGEFQRMTERFLGESMERLRSEGWYGGMEG